MLDPVLWLLLLALAGVVAGVMAGLLGIGGGLVFVPALLGLYRAQGVPESIVMHLAVGTSLAAIVLTSLSSIRSHAKRDNVDWPVFRDLLPGLLAGGLLGAAFAGVLSGGALRLAFALFVAILAVRMFFRARVPPAGTLPGKLALAGAGTGIAGLSALLGVGGGTLTVPFLMRCGVGVLRAVGTAAATGLPLALAGAAGFTVVGWAADDLPGLSTGFIWWPAALVLGLVAMASAPLGVRWAHRADPVLLRRVFALVLLLVAGGILN